MVRPEKQTKGDEGMRKEYQPLLLWERMWRHNLKVEGKNTFNELLPLLGTLEKREEEEEDVVDEEEDIVDAD